MLKPMNNHEIERADTLYDLAEKGTYLALRARHEKSGLQFLAELQNATRQDQRTRDRVALVERITAEENRLEELSAEYKEARATRDYCLAQSQRVTLTDEERTAFIPLYHKAVAECDRLKHQVYILTNQITAMYEELENNSSDRADIIHDAIIQALINEQNPAPITQKTIDHHPTATADELQNIANFNAVTNASGRAITHLATPNALNSKTTKAEKVDDTFVAEWLEQHGGRMGKGYRVAVPVRRARLSDCFLTLEERHTKTQDGFYLVKHYSTVAPYQYIDRNENGESEIDYLKTYNPFVSNQADLEQLEELITTANLTDREQILINAFASGCRYYADYKECRSYAFRVLYQKRGQSYKEETRERIFNRLIEKLRNRYQELKTR